MLYLNASSTRSDRDNQKHLLEELQYLSTDLGDTPCNYIPSCDPLFPDPRDHHSPNDYISMSNPNTSLSNLDFDTDAFTTTPTAYNYTTATTIQVTHTGEPVETDMLTSSSLFHDSWRSLHTNTTTKSSTLPYQRHQSHATVAAAAVTANLILRRSSLHLSDDVVPKRPRSTSSGKISHFSKPNMSHISKTKSRSSSPISVSTTRHDHPHDLSDIIRQPECRDNHNKDDGGHDEGDGRNNYIFKNKLNHNDDNAHQQADDDGDANDGEDDDVNDEHADDGSNDAILDDDDGDDDEDDDDGDDDEDDDDGEDDDDHQGEDIDDDDHHTYASSLTALDDESNLYSPRSIVVTLPLQKQQVNATSATTPSGSNVSSIRKTHQTKTSSKFIKITPPSLTTTTSTTMTKLDAVGSLNVPTTPISPTLSEKSNSKHLLDQEDTIDTQSTQQTSVQLHHHQFLGKKSSTFSSSSATHRVTILHPSNVPAAITNALACAKDAESCRQRRAEAMERFRRKKAVRCYGRRVRYQIRKRIATTRPRVNGRFAKRSDVDHAQVHPTPPHH